MDYKGVLIKTVGVGANRIKLTISRKKYKYIYIYKIYIYSSIFTLIVQNLTLQCSGKWCLFNEYFLR